MTAAPATRAGVGAVNSGSIRTVPVNQSAGPLPDGWEPLRLISIVAPQVVEPLRYATFLLGGMACSGHIIPTKTQGHPLRGVSYSAGGNGSYNPFGYMEEWW